MNKNIPGLLLLLGIIPAGCTGQATNDVISRIDRQLKNGETSITKVLSDDSLMHLHSLTPFREVIKANAKPGWMSMITKTEPGTRVTIKGLVTDKNGIPQQNLLVYVYQTSGKGWYSDTGAHILINSGDMNHARLFAYVRTDEKGEFSYETIKPSGYPDSDLAAHIHIHFWNAGMRSLEGPGELLFDDDPRLIPERRRQALNSGFLISKNSGTDQRPVFEYRVVVN